MKFYKGQYTIVKYVPDLLKNEPINIGLIIHSSNENYIKSEFAIDKVKTINRYNKEIDIRIVKAIIDDLKKNFNSSNWIIRNRDSRDFQDFNLLEKLYINHSNQVQFSNPKGFITVDLEDEFKRIFEEMVYKEILTESNQHTLEKSMKKKLKDEFQKRDLIKSKIVIENHCEIGKFGETVKFDFKYKNGKPNMIQNLSFDKKSKDNMDYAKLWSKNFEDIKSMIKKNSNDEIGINVIYCPPSDELNNNNFKNVRDCLEEYSDNLIDYNDEEKLSDFIKKVEKTAHI